MTQINAPFGSVMINPDIPLVQPLTFYLDYSDTAYLEREMTVDENTHQYPQTVIDTLTKYRLYQPAFIRRGAAGLYHYDLKFYQKGQPFDLTGNLIRFVGTDSAGFYRDIVEGFDMTQANLGQIGWNPPSEVAVSPGDYRNAHFIIENAERTKALTTLDFTMKVIDNDVPLTEPAAHYISEYERLLANFKVMQDTGDKQLSYIVAMFTTIASDNITRLNTQVNKSIDDSEAKIDAENKKADDGLQDLQKRFTALTDQFNDLSEKMATADLVSKTDLANAIAAAVPSTSDEELDKIEKELGIV